MTSEEVNKELQERLNKLILSPEQILERLDKDLEEKRIKRDEAIISALKEMSEEEFLKIIREVSKERSNGKREKQKGYPRGC